MSMPRRPIVLLLVFAVLGLLFSSQVRRVEAGQKTKVVARELSGPVDRSRTFRVPLDAHHIAIHWRGSRDAQVRVAMSRDGNSFASAQRVVLDEVGEQRRNGET